MRQDASRQAAKDSERTALVRELAPGSFNECEIGFRRIFWACLFIFIDVRALIPDLVPDFIGWILVASALNRMMKATEELRKVRNVAYMLSALTVFYLFFAMSPRSATDKGAFLRSLAAVEAVHTVIVILTVLVLWRVCGFVARVAQSARDQRLARDALFRRKFLVGLMAADLVVPWSLLADRIRVALTPVILAMGLRVMFVLAVLLTVMMCLMMGLMKRAAHVCHGLGAAERRATDSTSDKRVSQ